MTLALLNGVLALDVGVLSADSLYVVNAAANRAHCSASSWSCSATLFAVMSRTRLR
jgi:hypothetical protein